MHKGTKVAVLSDGGLQSLVAMVAAREAAVLSQPGGASSGGFTYPSVVPFPADLWTDAFRLEVITNQCQRLNMSLVPRPEITHVSSAATGPEAEAAALLAAAFAAARSGVSRLIWPVTAGVGEHVDIDRACELHDKAILISRLVALDAANHGQPGFTIETPYADLSDDRLADLALDLSTPTELCWWHGPRAALGASESERWGRALARAGGESPARAVAEMS